MEERGGHTALFSLCRTYQLSVNLVWMCQRIQLSSGNKSATSTAYHTVLQVVRVCVPSLHVMYFNIIQISPLSQLIYNGSFYK